MNEPLNDGKLQVRNKRVFIDRPSKKGSTSFDVTPQLSADLARLPVEKLDGMDVEFELAPANKAPIRVREKGKAFVAPVVASTGAYGAKPGGHGGKPTRPVYRSPESSTAQGRPNSVPAVSSNRSGDFHNPYNFIPAPPRRGVGELADREPSGHHAYLPGQWSGVISVELETATPLLIVDAARQSTDDQDHKSFPVRLGPDGRPYLAPTSVKGMLRSAYEAVTNSRFGVFYNHDERLAFRTPAQIGLRMVPARIVVNAGSMTVQLLPGSANMGQPDGKAQGPVYAAWIQSYGPPGTVPNWGGLAKHGNSVWAYVTRWEHHSPEFGFWNVVALRDGKLPRPTDNPPETRRPWRKANPANSPQGRWEQGYVCITHKNMDQKHDERVFFVTSGHSQAAHLSLRLSVDDQQRFLSQWKTLIANYQELHRDEVAQGVRGPSATRRARWSRHVTHGGTKVAEQERELKDGTLCYALVRVAPAGSISLQGLYPVMIPRSLFERAPAELLPEELMPATTGSKLSPADRVFGWVNQDSRGSGAYRGQLRIGPVTCERNDAIQDFGIPGVPLAILGQPKPQQFRFYASPTKDGEPHPPKTPKDQAYLNGQGLRGRKVYPHHAGRQSEPTYWEHPEIDRSQQPDRQLVDGQQRTYFQEYRRPRQAQHDGDQRAIQRNEAFAQTNSEQRDNQNRSVQGWVKIGTKFRFDIHLTNLSDVELGALLWLLSLQPGQYHRLGGGKPLGFGSVRLSIASLDVRDGEAWRSWYQLSGEHQGRCIDAIGDDPKLNECRKQFENAVSRAYGQTFERVSFIQAFLQASRGYDDGLPIHYPRTTPSPNPDGQIYEWFVQNDRRENQFSLGTLVDDALPRT